MIKPDKTATRLQNYSFKKTKFGTEDQGCLSYMLMDIIFRNEISAEVLRIVKAWIFEDLVEILRNSIFRNHSYII